MEKQPSEKCGTVSGGMNNPSWVKAVRTTRKQKSRAIVLETATLEVSNMTALFGWVGRNVAYKDLSLLKLGFVFGLTLTEGRKSV